MKLNEMMQLWTIKNPGKNFFDGMLLPKAFTQDFLYNLILMEYDDMEVLYNNSELFHRHVSLFWDKNTPVFDKLSETTEYQYEPLDDHGYKSHTDQTGGHELGSERKEDGDHNITGSGNSGSTQKDFVNAFNQGNPASPKGTTETDANYTDTEHKDWTANNLYGENKNWDRKQDYTASGNKNHTYQDLIEQQRKVVNYHVEDLILRLWAQELMVAVW